MFSSRKLALAVAGVVVLGGFAFYYWQSARLKRLALEPQRIAVLRFENQTSDPELDPVGAALAVSLAERLSSLDRTEAFVAASSGEAAGRRATLLVHGRIEESNGLFRLSSSLERLPAREFEAAGSAQGPRASLPALVDPISDGIRSAVRPKGKLAALEFKTLEAAVHLGRSLETASREIATAELQSAAAAEPGCGLCWRRLVEISLAGGAREQAVAFAAASRGKPITPFSRAAIDLSLAAASNDREGQVRILEKMEVQRPGDAEIKARLGGLYASLGRWQAAAESYRRAVEIAPFEGALWNEFGYVLAWSGRSDEAVRALNEYARLDPDSANPQDSLGEAALLGGRFSEAINRFEECYRKDKKFNGGQAILKAALAAYLAGEKPRAASYVDRYLSGLGDASASGARLLHGQWQFILGNTSGAVETLEAVDPAIAALALASAGDWQAAAQRLAARSDQGAGRIRAVLAGEGRLPEELAGKPELAPVRGLSAALRGRWAEAAEEFSRAQRLVPANGSQASLLREAEAWALVMQGKTKEAARILGSRWPLPPEPGFADLALLVYPNLFYTRAEIAVSQGKKDEARRMYDLFLQYAGDRKDPFGLMARASAAARL